MKEWLEILERECKRMIINKKDIKIFNCKCNKFLPSPSTYKNESIVYTLNPSRGINTEELRKIDSLFVFYGDKETIQKNISKFIEEIKSSTIKVGFFYYDVNIKTVSEPDILTNNSCKLGLTFDLLNMYEDKKSITTSQNTTININSSKPCYANLELSASANVISYTVTINDTEIVVRNIKGGETVYIGSGKVTAGGKSKIDDVDIWEFPILKSGINKITVNREDVNLTIKYNERW